MPHSNIVVCEKATVRYHAPYVTNRCGPGPIDSGCDLLYSQYGPNVEFSFYVTNPGPFTIYEVGKLTHTTNVCI